MSNSTASDQACMQPVTNRRHNLDQETRGARNQRSEGKGRRRRAAAEQRRIDQQTWRQYVHETDGEYTVASRVDNRRRNRRSIRCNSRAYSPEDFFLDVSDYDLSLDVALALSLSFSEAGEDRQSGSIISSEMVDMSYESLALLENVKCVAPSVVVNSLVSFTLEESSCEGCHLNEVEELCAICQTDYNRGDRLMQLPCTHNFHHSCSSEWLLNYSKLCPVCKHDITDQFNSN